MAAILDHDPVTRKASSCAMWSTATSLLLIAVGTGGIKPCVTTFGGDQIKFYVRWSHQRKVSGYIFLSVLLCN
jgi:dipeptide/tripeptide permease